VQSERGLGRGILKGSLSDHGSCTAQTLFRRLEQQENLARQLRGMARQEGSGAQSDGNMTVVAACMHHACNLRDVGRIADLMNRQSVHVDAQHDGRSGFSARKEPDHAGLGNPGAHLAAKLAQSSRNDACGATFLEGQLGMRVQIATPRCELRSECFRLNTIIW